jgi:hypothetical protein
MTSAEVMLKKTAKVRAEVLLTVEEIHLATVVHLAEAVCGFTHLLKVSRNFASPIVKLTPETWSKGSAVKEDPEKTEKEEKTEKTEKEEKTEKTEKTETQNQTSNLAG